MFTKSSSLVFPAGFQDGKPLNAWEWEDLFYGFISPWEELAMIFSRYDESGFGEMTIQHFRAAIYEPDFRSVVTNLCGHGAVNRLEYRTLTDRAVTYQEFTDLVSNKRRHSFKVAVHNQDKDVMSLGEDYSDLERQKLPNQKAKIVYRLAEKFSPGDDIDKRKYYSLQYRCWPPPFFIPILTVVQATFFLYYSLSSKAVPGASGPVPVDSILIYRSDRRIELWRFVFYALLHAGWWHLIFNILVQLAIGLPLEMVHGSFRVSLIYLSGVLAGSLGTSVFDPEVFLVGASGGTYALLAAHVANVLLNYSQIDCGLVWIITSVMIASVDVGFAVWDRYSVTSLQDHPVSYVAHLAGAIAGLTLGLMILKNFDQKFYQNYLWWLAFVVFGACLVSAILWNIFFM